MEINRESLETIIKSAIESTAAARGVSLPENFGVLLERPKREGRGDWATNAAMKLSKVFKMSPMELASEISSRIEIGAVVGSVETAAPGFMNFFLAQDWVASAIENALSMGRNYGRNMSGAGGRVQVEFVSANPTGPLHLGHGRGGAVGDVMASVLEFSGWDVEREYYINDAGLQMENLGKSTQSRYFALYGREDEAPFPEDGYPGDYIDNIARRIAEERGDEFLSRELGETLAYFRDRTAEMVLDTIRADLRDFGVAYDVWFSERSLYDDDLVRRTISLLESRGFAYERDGAVWFKATAFGDEKDRVMIRENGAPTYFTSDIAYLLNKYERKFTFLIYVWGADHHGYVPRIRSVNKALGQRDESLEFMLIQFVSLLRNGAPVAMSKRAGTFVTLREVMDEVGKDATRFSFVNRKCDSHLDFDLEVAKQTSSDNPVYYVQYAYARISSILREASSRGVSLPAVSDADFGLLTEPSEIRLAKEISRFPEEVLKSSQNLEPHRIAFYATGLAEAFHAFYNTLKVLGAERSVMNARLLLSEAARITLANTLGLLGVTAPERM
jgi:arginyl-tRNA synthetase